MSFRPSLRSRLVWADRVVVEEHILEGRPDWAALQKLLVGWHPQLYGEDFVIVARGKREKKSTSTTTTTTEPSPMRFRGGSTSLSRSRGRTDRRRRRGLGRCARRSRPRCAARSARQATGSDPQDPRRAAAHLPELGPTRRRSGRVPLPVAGLVFVNRLIGSSIMTTLFCLFCFVCFFFCFSNRINSLITTDYVLGLNPFKNSSTADRDFVFRHKNLHFGRFLPSFVFFWFQHLGMFSEAANVRFAAKGRRHFFDLFCIVSTLTFLFFLVFLGFASFFI